MKITQIIGALMVSILVSVSALGQMYPVGYSEKYYSSPENYAVVPIQKIIDGGQHGVTSELLTQVNYVEATLVGKSVVGNWNGTYIGREELLKRGYVNDGVFRQLALALGGLPFSANIVKLPQGYYDARVEMTFRTRAGKACLYGNAWPGIWDRGDGTLGVSEATPYISVPEAVAVKFEGKVRSARWLGSDYQAVDLPTSWNQVDNSSLVTLFQNMFEDGTLVVAYEQQMPDVGYRIVTRGYDLTNGAVIEGKDLFVRLGDRANSSAVIDVSSFAELEHIGYQFYTSYGQLYGNFPMVEFTPTERFDGVIPISVPVWGSDTRVSPANVLVEIKASPDAGEIGSQDRVMKGTPVHFRAGVTYHLKLSFPGVRSDGGGKG